MKTNILTLAIICLFLGCKNDDDMPCNVDNDIKTSFFIIVNNDFVGGNTYHFFLTNQNQEVLFQDSFFTNPIPVSFEINSNDVIDFHYVYGFNPNSDINNFFGGSLLDIENNSTISTFSANSYIRQDVHVKIANVASVEDVVIYELGHRIDGYYVENDTLHVKYFKDNTDGIYFLVKANNEDDYRYLIDSNIPSSGIHAVTTDFEALGTSTNSISLSMYDAARWYGRLSVEQDGIFYHVFRNLPPADNNLGFEYLLPEPFMDDPFLVSIFGLGSDNGFAHEKRISERPDLIEDPQLAIMNEDIRKTGSKITCSENVDYVEVKYNYTSEGSIFSNWKILSKTNGQELTMIPPQIPSEIAAKIDALTSLDDPIGCNVEIWDVDARNTATWSDPLEIEARPICNSKEYFFSF